MLQGAPPPLADGETAVLNLAALLDRAKIPARVRSEICKDVAAFGAVDVRELSFQDWEASPCWASILKVAERRRIMAIVGAANS